MPITRQVNDVEQLAFVRVSGRVTVPEVLNHLRTIRHAPRRYPTIVDVREAAGVDFGPRDLLSVAIAAREALGDAPAEPRAVIVADARSFRQARTVASLVAGWMRVGVFDDAMEADAWLEQASIRHADAIPQH